MTPNEVQVREPLADAALAQVKVALDNVAVIREATEEAAYALSIVVTDAASCKRANEALVRIARGTKAIESGRKPLTQKIDAAKRVVMDYVKVLAKPLEDADAYLQQQVKAFNAKVAAEQERERVERERMLAEAAKAGGPPPVVRSTAPTAPPTGHVEGGSTNIVYRVEVELVNPHDAPEQLLILGPGAKDWAEAQIVAGNVDLPKVEGNETVHRGIRIRWATTVRKVTA